MLGILSLVFLIALIGLSGWWAYNTMKQIQLQKEFAAFPLRNIIKLWKKAQYIPEDARERESLYLYRDFLQKFERDECKYPIMVKNGGVRCMTRTEYDKLCQQVDKKPYSVLLLVLTGVYFLAALIFNMKNIILGICLALLAVAIEGALAFFIYKVNKDKNAYRDGLFLELKENSTDFLRLTKPFILVDSYPQKFGKGIPPLFVGLGELTPEQITEAREFIRRQKAAETKVVLQTVTTIAPEPTATPATIVNTPAASEVTAVPAAPVITPVAPEPQAPTPAEPEPVQDNDITPEPSAPSTAEPIIEPTTEPTPATEPVVAAEPTVEPETAPLAPEPADHADEKSETEKNTKKGKNKAKNQENSPEENAPEKNAPEESTPQESAPEINPDDLTLDETRDIIYKLILDGLNAEENGTAPAGLTQELAAVPEAVTMEPAPATPDTTNTENVVTPAATETPTAAPEPTNEPLAEPTTTPEPAAPAQPANPAYLLDDDDDDLITTVNPAPAPDTVPTVTAEMPTTETPTANDDDDFSLDSIARALDAEIAKRQSGAM